MPRPDELLDLASLASLAVLGALALKRLVRMGKFQVLLVLVLTSLLWLPVLYLFAVEWPLLTRGGCFSLF